MLETGLPFPRRFKAAATSNRRERKTCTDVHTLRNAGKLCSILQPIVKTRRNGTLGKQKPTQN
jgi:hypothetical protein